MRQIILLACLLTPASTLLGFESGVIFHHWPDCATVTATCDTDDNGNGACIHWIDIYHPAGFDLHASAAADGSISLPLPYWVYDGSAQLNYNYTVPYSAWREVKLDTEYSACQLYAHFPVIHKFFSTTAPAGASTDSNPSEYRTSAGVDLLRYGGTEIPSSEYRHIVSVDCGPVYGCHPDDCPTECNPESETSSKYVFSYLSADENWVLPEANTFILEDVDGLQVEHSHLFPINMGSCNDLPTFEIDLGLSASSLGWPNRGDGGEALACFGAYGNLANFNYAKCPIWDGGPHDPEPPGGAGIRVVGQASQVGIDTDAGPLVVSVPVRQLWHEYPTGAWEIVEPDTDCDGVIDSADLCPLTPPSSLVNDAGCTGSQFIDFMCNLESCDQHGKYVSCVAQAAKGAVNQGLITKKEKARFIRDAAKCE